MSIVGLDLCKKFDPLNEHDNLKEYSNVRIISKKIEMHLFCQFKERIYPRSVLNTLFVDK